MAAHPETAPPGSADLARLTAPPHDLEAEMSVLGAILISDRTLYTLVIEEGLRPEDFYRERHRLVYAAMLELYNLSEPVDVVTVTAHLREHGKLEEAGGESAVDALAGAPPSVSGARRYAQIVRENALLRRLLTTTYGIQAEVAERRFGPRDLVERAEKQMLEVAHDDRQSDFREIREILSDELQKMQLLSQQGTSLTGTPSGFKDLDEITGGFQAGNLIIIAARPSMGKSALVTNIAENASIDHGRAVALFSLEMSETELAQRFVASQGRIFGDKLRKGKVPQSEWQRILTASQKLAKAPLYVDDSSDIGILDIRAKARRLHTQADGGLGLIIVDYLQLLRPDAGTDNRVEQVGQMSRGLKILARELNVPVIALSQLSRAVEQRHDKKPVLSDLRECVTGDTLVVLADGRRVPIRELVGTTPDVVAVDERDRLVTARSDKVWPVGRRAIHRVRLASGRTLRATTDHRVRCGDGWRRFHEIAAGDRVAISRRLPEPVAADRWPADHVVLLGQLIGDGSYLSGQPLRYTTTSEDNSRAVAEAADRSFESRVTRHPGRGGWHQLVLAGNGNRWAPAGVNRWLRDLGIFNQRSHEKRVPAAAFRLADDQIGLLLRHLWATDGTIFVGRRPDGRTTTRVAYSTNSPGLAQDVAALLLRLGVVARTTIARQGAHRPAHHVVVSGAEAQTRFLGAVGAFGPRAQQAEALRALLALTQPTTNVDTLPRETWPQVRAAMTASGVTRRDMAALRGTSYGGTSHFHFAPSRATLADYARLLDDQALAALAESDLFWDRVVAIEPAGEEEVYDLTVPGPACWLADGIVSHNSGQIEQDADLVMFIYRDEYYNKEESEDQGLADILIAKHRNGGLGDVTLTFRKEYPKFLNYAREERYQ
jgi:replicative DNA helicase